MIDPSGGPMVAIVVFLLITVFSAVASLAQPVAPVSGLNCAQPSKVEAVVCADPGLRERDAMIIRILPKAGLDAFGKESPRQLAAQARWLKQREESQCPPAAFKQCVMSSYNFRLEELAVATLFRDPSEALEALRLANAEAVPLYEAIYRYATIDESDQRTQTVAALIAPLFQKIHDSPEGALAPLSQIKSAEEAAASDKQFSIFLGMAGSGGGHLIMPCEALIRRPGLTYTLGPFYGGARDGFLPRSDCETRLPELPMLDNAFHAARAAQVCPGNFQGTIRFSVWRYAEKLLLAARLHQPENWESTTGYVKPIDEREQQFRQAQGLSINSAKEELATYFVDFFKVPNDAAKAQAYDVVEKIVSNSFFQCGG